MTIYPARLRRPFLLALSCTIVLICSLLATTAQRATAQAPQPPDKPAVAAASTNLADNPDLFVDKIAWQRWQALPVAVKAKVDPRIFAELSGAVTPAHQLLDALEADADVVHLHEAFVPPSQREPLAATRFIVYMVQQPDLAPFIRGDGQVTSSAANEVDAATRRTRVWVELAQTAQTAQAGVRAALVDAQQAGDVESFQSFYIVNAMAVEGGLATLAALAQRPDVERIAANYPLVPLWDDAQSPAQQQDDGNWNIELVGAPRVWAELGVRGEGVTVAGFDTGVNAEHPGLAQRYRGYSERGLEHNYNWFEPDGTLNPDGNLGASVSNASRDCAFSTHGTHTMGTMVGEPTGGAGNGATQVGMAPRAQWIAVPGICGNTMNGVGLGDDIGGLKAFQWLLCPTDLSGDLSTADCSRAPAVVNNSWGSANPVSDVFRPAIQALRAAGIAPVFAAGNPSADEGSIGSPANAPEAITVSATDRDDRVAAFSARGPSFYPGEQKPELSAPGVGVRSTVGTSQYSSYSGTSMAAPHVAGLIALLVAADLRDGFRDFDVDDLERAMIRTAVDLGPTGPDNDYGYGRIDAFAAVNWALAAGDLRGVVSDGETGKPLADATVTGSSGDQRFATRTDADGRYAITVPAGRYTVQVDAWGYGTAEFVGQTVFADSLSTADFALAPQPTIQVDGVARVGNVPAALASRGIQPGDAIAVARIYVRQPPDAAGQRQAVAETTSGADGRYSIALPPGQHEIVIEASGYRPATRAVDVNDNNVDDDNVLLQEEQALDAVPSVLLVDADAHGGWFGGWSVRPIFERALAAENYSPSVDIWRIEYLGFEDTRERVDGSTGHGIPSAETLAAYDVVVWAHSGCGGLYCFRGGSPASIGAEAVLIGYLDGGGRLLLSGQNIGAWDDERSVLFDRYLRLDRVRDGAADEGERLVGQEFLADLDLPLTNAALFGYNNGVLYFTPDAVAVDADPENLADDSDEEEAAPVDDAGNDNGVAFPILSYANGAGAAALAIQPCDAPHRAVFLGMGFEAIGPRANRESPQYSAVLGRSLDWLLESKPAVAVSLASSERERVAAPGEQARYTLRLTNRGAQPTSVELALSGEWTARLFVDELDAAGDPLPLDGPVALAPCEAQLLTLAVDVPASLANNAQATLSVTATPSGEGGEPSSITLLTRAFASWTPQPTMPTLVSRHATAALPGDVALYTFGGFLGSSGNASASVQRFDACARRWEEMSPLPERRTYSAAAALDGKFYVAGGLTGGDFELGESNLSSKNTLYVYDPAADAWSEASSLPQPLLGAALAAVGDKLYLVGGSGSDGNELATLYEYNPTTDAWRERAPLPAGPRVLAAAAALGSGLANGLDEELIVVGGWPDLRTAEIYSPAADRWRSGAELLHGRHSAGLVAGPEGALYLTGGGVRWLGTEVVERYDAQADAWVEISPLARGDYFGGAAFVAGQIVAAGGTQPAATEALRLSSSFCQSDATLDVPGVQPGAAFSYTVALQPDRQPLTEVRVEAVLPENVRFVGFGENGIGATYDAATRTVAWAGDLLAAQNGDGLRFVYAVELTGEAGDGQRIESPVRFRAVRADGRTLAFERTARTRIVLPNFANSAVVANRDEAISGDVLRFDVQVRSATIAGGRASLRGVLPPQLELVPDSLNLPPGTLRSSFDATTRTLTWTGDTQLDPNVELNDEAGYGWRDSNEGRSPATIASERAVGDGIDNAESVDPALVQAADANVTFDWIDIRETGTRIGAGDDLTVCDLPVGFAFAFYGESHEAFCVSTNGVLSFEGGAANSGSVPYTNACPLSNAPTQNLIAALWDDLVVLDGIYYQTLDDASGRYLVVQWAEALAFRGFGTGQLLHFELILHESGAIKAQYQRAAASASESATVGLLGPTRAESLTYACDEPEALADELAVFFLPPGGSTSTAQATIAFEASVAENVQPNTLVSTSMVVQSAGESFTRTSEVLLNPLDLSESTAAVVQPQINLGERQDYQFVLRNTGLYTATTAALSYPLGNALSGLEDSVACSSGACELAGNEVTWTGTIAAGKPITLSFGADLTARLPDRTPVTGTATLGDGYGNIINLTTSFVARSSDLTQSSVVMRPRFVEPGMVVTAELIVRNTGTVASEASVQMTLPDGLRVVDDSLVCGTGTCALTDGKVSWAGLVAAREAVPVRVRVQVPQSTPLGREFAALVAISDGNRGETFELSTLLTVADLTWMSFVRTPPAPVEIYLPLVGR